MSNFDPQNQAADKKQAFLVVNGADVVLLSAPLINLGRKQDNDIVIDSEHISRYHAQIRKINGQYLLLDLESTVGTSVNGKKITQTYLKPGDVISLAGTPIIFGIAAADAEIKISSLGTQYSGSTGPTESADIHSADNYLDLFNTPHKEKKT